MSEQNGLARPKSRMERVRRRWYRAAVSVASVLVLIVIGGGAWWSVDHVFGNCSGMQEHPATGQCFGLTDGSTSLHPDLEPVEGKIKQENDAIQALNQDTVTIALLTPVPADPEKGPVDPYGPPQASVQQIRAQWEGAYTKQHEFNHNPDGTLRQRPTKLRLVIAAEGPNERQWDEVTGEILAKKDSERIVAVTGLGVSSIQTEAGARKLGLAGIPMIGTVLTADNLNAHNFPNLYRVSPGNNQEVAALAEAGQELPGKKILVRDTARNDSYTNGLAGAFQANIQGVEQPEMPFDGTTQNATSQFYDISLRACTGQPTTVLYAGRANVFQQLVERLSKPSNCGGNVTVATGSDGSKIQEMPDAQGVKVVYAALAAPEALGDPRFNPGLSESYKAVEREYSRHGFPADGLENGWGIMSYNAMAAAQAAIDRHYRPGNARPADAGAVRTMLLQMRELGEKVPGAAGSGFSFGKDGTPRGQRIDVMRLDPGKDRPVVVHPDQ